MRKQRKPYWEMTTAELREATREFDADFAYLKGKPLTAADRRVHALARKYARLQTGGETVRVWVSLERGLLAETDRVAKKLGMSRSELIARGLRTVLTRGAA